MGQRAALYCRVSTADQSCERQERDLLAFAVRGGYDVVRIFRETASGSKNQRPERLKVMALAQDRQIQAVLVTELTRWGRSTTDLLSTLHHLEACGVSVISQTGLQFDLRSPQGKLFSSLMAALADVTNPAAVAGMVAATVRRFGRVDILVNNAALRREKTFDAMTLDDWREVMTATLDSAFICCKAVVPGMLARK